MCSRLPLVPCRPVYKKNWLDTFRQLCVYLVWLGIHFIFIIISSHANCSFNLYSTPCTMTLAIYRGVGLGIHLSFDMCCWNEWLILATIVWT